MSKPPRLFIYFADTYINPPSILLFDQEICQTHNFSIIQIDHLINLWIFSHIVRSQRGNINSSHKPFYLYMLRRRFLVWFQSGRCTHMIR